MNGKYLQGLNISQSLYDFTMFGGNFCNYNVHIHCPVNVRVHCYKQRQCIGLYTVIHSLSEHANILNARPYSLCTVYLSVYQHLGYLEAQDP